MSVEQPSVVDAIGTDKNDSAVVLTVSDHLTWQDEQHLSLLEAKLGAYVSFIESGQILEAYPSAAGKTLRISIVCKYRPSEIGIRFLNAAELELQSRTIQLAYGPIPNDGYCDDHA